MSLSNLRTTLLLALLGLAGCGQKGALYLPERKPAVVPATPAAPAPAAPAPAAPAPAPAPTSPPAAP